jgi:hypothetical protein
MTANTQPTTSGTMESSQYGRAPPPRDSTYDVVDDVAPVYDVVDDPSDHYGHYILLLLLFEFEI